MTSLTDKEIKCKRCGWAKMSRRLVAAAAQLPTGSRYRLAMIKIAHRVAKGMTLQDSIVDVKGYSRPHAAYQARIWKERMENHDELTCDLTDEVLLEQEQEITELHTEIDGLLSRIGTAELDTVKALRNQVVRDLGKVGMEIAETQAVIDDAANTQAAIGHAKRKLRKLDDTKSFCDGASAWLGDCYKNLAAVRELREIDLG